MSRTKKNPWALFVFVAQVVAVHADGSCIYDDERADVIGAFPSQARCRKKALQVQAEIRRAYEAADLVPPRVRFGMKKGVWNGPEFQTRPAVMSPPAVPARLSRAARRDAKVQARRHAKKALRATRRNFRSLEGES